MSEWTVERVLQRYPNCAPDTAKEVAELLNWAHNKVRTDTGEKLSPQKAQQAYDIGVALATN